MPLNRTESRIQGLLSTITHEYQAAQLALNLHVQDPNRHDFINQCLDRIALAHADLKQLVGPDEAARLIIKQMDSSEQTQELEGE